MRRGIFDLLAVSSTFVICTSLILSVAGDVVEEKRITRWVVSETDAFGRYIRQRETVSATSSNGVLLGEPSASMAQKERLNGWKNCWKTDPCLGVLNALRTCHAKNEVTESENDTEQEICLEDFCNTQSSMTILQKCQTCLDDAAVVPNSNLPPINLRSTICQHASTPATEDTIPNLPNILHHSEAILSSPRASSPHHAHRRLPPRAAEAPLPPLPSIPLATQDDTQICWKNCTSLFAKVQSCYSDIYLVTGANPPEDTVGVANAFDPNSVAQSRGYQGCLCKDWGEGDGEGMRKKKGKGTVTREEDGDTEKWSWIRKWKWKRQDDSKQEQDIGLDVPQPAYRYCSSCLERVQFDEAGRLFFWLVFHNFCRTEKPSAYLFFRDLLSWLRVAGATDEDWLVLNTTQRAGSEIVGVTSWEGRWRSSAGLNEVTEVGSETTMAVTTSEMVTGTSATETATATKTGTAHPGGGEAAFSSKVAPFLPLLTQMPGYGNWPYTQYGVARRRGSTARWTLTVPASEVEAAEADIDGAEVDGASSAAATVTGGRPTAVIEAELQWYPRPLGPNRKAHATPGMEFAGVRVRIMNPAAWSPGSKATATSSPRSGSGSSSSEKTQTSEVTFSGTTESSPEKNIGSETSGASTGSVTASSSSMPQALPEMQTQTPISTSTSTSTSASSVPQPQTTTMGAPPPDTPSMETESISSTTDLGPPEMTLPDVHGVPQRPPKSKTWPINPNIGPVLAKTG